MGDRGISTDYLIRLESFLIGIDNAQSEPPPLSSSTRPDTPPCAVVSTSQETKTLLLLSDAFKSTIEKALAENISAVIILTEMDHEHVMVLSGVSPGMKQVIALWILTISATPFAICHNVTAP